MTDAHSVPFALLAGVLGAIIGSFLNVVIHRVPRGESIVRPSSHCPGCGHPIRPWDNVPILSWLWLRGRCRDCGTPISLRYPLIEATNAGVFAGIAIHFGATPMALLWMAFAAALLAAAIIDLDHRIIPDEISLGGLAVGLTLVPLGHWLEGAPLSLAWLHAASGALVGGGILWGVGFAHARVCALAGRRFEHWPGEGEDFPRPSSADFWMWFPGMGFGDVKLLAMIGAFLGPVGVIWTLVAASALGLVFGLVWGLVRHSFHSPFGFGPALALGALLVLLLPLE